MIDERQLMCFLSLLIVCFDAFGLVISFINKRKYDVTTDANGGACIFSRDVNRI
jgi:hypothetical protein